MTRFGEATAPWVDRRTARVLALAAVLYVPFAFLGPGAEVESYRVIGVSDLFLRTGEYLPSRYPGYFVHEFATGALYALGGSLLTNLGSVGMSLLAIVAFVRICALGGVPNRHLLALAMILHPVYWIGSTSTLDDVWALALGLLGIALFMGGRTWLAGIALGLSIGTRINAAVFVAALAPVALWLDRTSWRNVAVVVSATGLVATLCYVPPFLHAGGTLGFLTFSRAEWTWWDYAARIAYKNVYFWGLPAALVLLASVPWIGRSVRRAFERRSHAKGGAFLAGVAGLVVLGSELTFARIPQSLSYLLPILPFALVLVGLGLKEHRAVLIGFVALVASYNLVNVNIARPDVPDHATTASLGLWIEPGLLPVNVRERRGMWAWKLERGIDSWGRPEEREEPRF